MALNRSRYQRCDPIAERLQARFPRTHFGAQVSQQSLPSWDWQPRRAPAASGMSGLASASLVLSKQRAQLAQQVRACRPERPELAVVRLERCACSCTRCCGARLLSREGTGCLRAGAVRSAQAV